MTTDKKKELTSYPEGDSGKKTQNQINVENMLDRMNEIERKTGSNTFCTAKWLQSTVYLMNGHTHSCHHPAVHKIPVEEVRIKPSALHNTQHKIKSRVEMMQGNRPKECDYCWNIEDLGSTHISDRTYKSTDVEWSYPNLQKVIESKEGGDISPTYLEVAFDHTCNLKCMYCTPDISSKWMEESRQYGPYQGTTYSVGGTDWLEQTGKIPISPKEYNPYVEAFWEWWPDLYQSLSTFRITGGEPLLSKHTWRVLEEIKNNPRGDLTLAINTNMQVPDALIDKLIEYYNAIAPKVKSFDIYTSCEASGKQAEYIRFGMDYEKFMENCDKFLSQTGDTSRLHFMIAFNMLSLSSFKDFLLDIWKMRSKFNPDDAMNRIPMMINYIRWPQFQDVKIAPKEIKEKYIKEIQDAVNAHTRYTSPNGKGRFYLEEIDQISRLKDYMFSNVDDAHMEIQLNDIGAFYPEYDRRKNLNFSEVFPELNDFLQSCIEIHNGKKR